MCLSNKIRQCEEGNDDDVAESDEDMNEPNDG